MLNCQGQTKLFLELWCKEGDPLTEVARQSKQEHPSKRWSALWGSTWRRHFSTCPKIFLPIMDISLMKRYCIFARTAASGGGTLPPDPWNRPCWVGLGESGQCDHQYWMLLHQWVLPHALCEKPPTVNWVRLSSPSCAWYNHLNWWLGLRFQVVLYNCVGMELLVVVIQNDSCTAQLFSITTALHYNMWHNHVTLPKKVEYSHMTNESNYTLQLLSMFVYWFW